jgi:hypothetical protein
MRGSIFPFLRSSNCHLKRLHFPILRISRLSAHWENLFFHLLDPSFVSSLRESIFPSLGSFVCQLTERLYFPSLGSSVFQLSERIYFSISWILRLSPHWETLFFHLWDPPFVRGHWKALFFNLSSFPFVRSLIGSLIILRLLSAHWETVFSISRIHRLSGVTERLYFSICRILRLSGHL